jgi:hypothetical protein
MSKLLDATGAPLSPPEPRDVIFKGGVPAVQMFHDAVTALAQYQQAAQAHQQEAQIYRVLASTLVGLLGGEVVVVAELDKAVRERAPMICLERGADGSWHAWLAHVAGERFDPKNDLLCDLSGHLVACRGAVKAAHAAAEAQA